VAVASAGPYANHLHLLQTDNHASTSSLSFLQAGCPSCCPTNSIKELKANTYITIIIINYPTRLGTEPWPIPVTLQAQHMLSAFYCYGTSAGTLKAFTLENVSIQSTLTLWVGLTFKL